MRGAWRGGAPRGVRGNPPGSGRGGLDHLTASGPGTRPCRFFQANSTCRFGATCKFSHEQDIGDGADRRQAAEARPTSFFGDVERREYNQWKRFLHRQPSPQLEYNITTLVELWSGALEILDSNRHESQQRLISDLVSDKSDTFGCQYLHLTLKLRVADGGHTPLLLRNFFRTITHPSILDSLSMDTYVGTLYNMISGSRGERAVAFFLDVTQGLSDPSFHISISALDDCLCSMLEALYQLFCREKRASFHEDIPELLLQMGHLSYLLDAGEPNRLQPRPSRRGRLDTLRRIVNISTGLVKEAGGSETDKHTTSQPDTLSVFPIHGQYPGGRHDNDHEDISCISIFPTRAEIVSDLPEFLPSTDCRQPHFHTDPVQRYVDTHFRLLRHDIYGPLKAVLGPLMLAFQGDMPPMRLPGQDMGAHLYQDAAVVDLSADKRGLIVHIEFSFPSHLRHKNIEERRRWWESSKRLEPGGLICLVSSLDGSVMPLLMLVADKLTEVSQEKKSFSNKNTGTVLAKLTTLGLQDMRSVMDTYNSGCRGVLVALPGLIPATFTPILRNLQDIVGVGELAFHEYLVPNAEEAASGEAGERASNPPLYSQGPGFHFSLEPILTGTSPMYVRSTDSPDDPVLLRHLGNRTGLDAGQCRALIYALTREYALIQGPPGTGKSYLGVKLLQVLLESQRECSLGPIIVICYTNHALDQFLLNLLASGARKIIRIGGQSRCPELSGHNLRAVADNMCKTSLEGYLLGKTYSERDAELMEAEERLKTLRQLQNGLSWSSMRRYIQWRHPGIYKQLIDDEIDGFKLVTDKDPLQRWLGLKNVQCVATATRGPLPLADLHAADLLAARAENDVDSLRPFERRALAEHWVRVLQDDETEQLFTHILMSESLREEVESVHSEVSRRALQTADVIGVTTTGLAKDIAILRNLRAKIVVCEEAAEVLEAHIISALMPGVQHVIQIGDHQQLRPQINNYSLSLETPRGKLYQLDRSQFERLAVGEPGVPKLPVAQLNIQRRMRPEIANLIRNAMYPSLEDHDSVAALPDVVGMRDNVFWLTHDKPEDASNHDGRIKSHSNQWEVDMTTALVRHLVRQGEYASTDIAVLTPYSGQLQKLRTALSGDFEVFLSDRDEDTLAKDDFHSQDENEVASEGRLQKKGLIDSLRLATVDNFQGEEAKIIVVSLVRSNADQKVGFLRTENRINVLLSRAQHGMYLIGNADTYAGIPMWVCVHRQLRELGAVGPAFNLCCPRHKDTPIQCAEPEHFLRLSPEGGCYRPCDRRLDQCGHRCQSKCHSTAMHNVFLCLQACPRVRPTCQHQCPKLCGESCGPCQVLVDGVELPCGHTVDGVRCCESQQPADISCNFDVEKTVATCGHVVTAKCATDVDSVPCPALCNELLPCGHPCGGTCGTCRPRSRVFRVSHSVCNKICGRPRNTCNHDCRRRCHADKPCPPCDRPCEMRCAHSRCSLGCKDPCAPCIERCAWTCEHQGRCSMPCAAPCNRLPCDERCSKLLGCGHRCPGLCGEPCPETYCQECGPHGEQRVDLLEFKTYKEIDLNESPIVVLGCGHFFAAESLDGMARLAEVYSTDCNGHFVGLLEPAALLPVPSCPDCKRPLRQSATQRYNRVVNAAVLDETSQRFLVKGLTQLEALEARIDDAEKALHHARAATSEEPGFSRLPEWRRRTVQKPQDDKYNILRYLEGQVSRFCRTMSTEQQPSKKLADAIMEAKTRQPLDARLAGVTLNDGPKRTVENRVTLGGTLARLRIEAAIFTDQLSGPLTAELTTVRNSVQALVNQSTALLNECTAFIDNSSENSLPRLAIMGSLIHARVAHGLQAFTHKSQTENAGRVVEYVATAKRLLAKAEKMCDSPFSGADQLRQDLEVVQRLLGREWYDPVTKEELAAIRAAMVSGPSGIATHSGHWYKCPNGHTFAIGECGMPMELARCPECGSGIGGQSHDFVEGVTRATDMEMG